MYDYDATEWPLVNW